MGFQMSESFFRSVEVLSDIVVKQQRLLSAYEDLERAICRAGLPHVIISSDQTYIELCDALAKIKEARQ